MKTLSGLVAVSLISLGLMGCGSVADRSDEVTTEQAGGTSDMMDGDNDQADPSLGTAQGEDLDDVDVKMNPNMQHTEEEMVGADEIEEQKSELR